MVRSLVEKRAFFSSEANNGLREKLKEDVRILAAFLGDYDEFITKIKPENISTDGLYEGQIETRKAEIMRYKAAAEMKFNIIGDFVLFAIQIFDI